MAVLGPITLNGGWVSDADIWNDPGDGRCFTYQCFSPWLGGAKVCDGFNALVAQLPTTTQVLGAFYWQDPAQEGNIGTAIYIALNNTPKCYTAPSNSGTWTDRTNAVTLASTTYYTFDVLNGKVLIANPNGNTSINPFKITAFNGNIAVLGGSPPNGGIVKVVNNFAFLAQNFSAVGTLSRVYWSNVVDPETWAATSFIDVNLNDGDIITGLASIGTNLIIFKTNSVWSLSTITVTVSGTVTLGPLTLLSSKHGCVGQHAIDTMPDGSLVFLSGDGHLYQTDGTTFNDLSHLPFPNSNMAFPIVTNSSGGAPSYYYFPYSHAMVKVDSEMHRIFTVFSAFSGSQHAIYVYDFFAQAWADWTAINKGTNNVFYLTALPYTTNAETNLGGVRPRIVFGSANGFLYMDSPWIGGTVGVFDQTAQLNATIEKTIPLLQKGQYFTPYWIIVPYQVLGSSFLGTLSITIGFDGTYQGSTIASVSITGNGRINARIPFDITATQALRPYSMQVKFIYNANVSGAPVVIEPFYIADEIPA